MHRVEAQRLFLAPIALVLAACAIMPTVAAARPTRISLTFDDGSASEFQTRAMLAAHDMRATFYVNSGLLGSDPYHMTWDQVRALAGDGHEIGGHTSEHVDLTALSAPSETADICRDRDAIVNHGLPAAASFAYPYARWNAAARDAVAACGYTSARGVGNVGCTNCSSAETLAPTDPYVLRTVAGALASSTLAEFEGVVTNAIQNGGGWVIFVFHTICDDCDDSNATPAARLDALLDWLHSQQSNGVSVMPVRDVMALAPPSPPENMLQNAGLEAVAGTGGPVCWTRADYTGASGASSVFSWAGTADAHTGANAESVTISSYGDGDEKLLVTQDPVVTTPAGSAATPIFGGTLSGTQYYMLTSTTANGETQPGAELEVNASGGVELTWRAAKGATGYRIYRASAPGQETLLAAIGAETTYTDTGTITPGSATPPAVNTAARGVSCAPSATPGHVYEASGWYKTSASANVRMVIYYRDAAGSWIFWRQQFLPSAPDWTQGHWQTPVTPVGATALSLAFSLRSVGTLTVDDLLLGDISS